MVLRIKYILIIGYYKIVWRNIGRYMAVIHEFLFINPGIVCLLFEYLNSNCLIDDLYYIIKCIIKVIW